MQLIHCFFWNVTKMHQYSTDCIFMTGNENSLSFIYRLGYNSLRVERNWTLHAIPQTLRFRKLSMDLKWLCLNTSIDCLRQRDAEIFYILGSLVIISRITKWVGRHWWWPNLESTTPFLIKRRWMSAKWNNYICRQRRCDVIANAHLKLFFPVFIGNHLFTFASESSIHALPVDWLSDITVQLYSFTSSHEVQKQLTSFNLQLFTIGSQHVSSSFRVYPNVQ